MSHVSPVPTYLLVIIEKNFLSPNALFGTLLALSIGKLKRASDVIDRDSRLMLS